MSSIFFPESAALASDSSGPECEPSHSVKSSRTAAPSSPIAGPVSRATEALKSSAGQSQQTLFAEDSLAKTSALPARVLGWRERVAAYGASTPELLARFDQSSRLWKTSQHCLVEGLETFSETWPRSGTMRNGIAYRLPPLVPLTEEIESGSLPTPVSVDSGAYFNRSASQGAALRPTLGAMAKHGLWPTPTATLGTNGGRVTKAKGREGGTLIEALSARTRWPTPTAGDSKASGSRNTINSKAHAGVSLTDAVRGDLGTGRLWPTPTTQNAKCNGSHPAPASRQGGMPLQEAVKMWPTPASKSDSGGVHGMDGGARARAMLRRNVDEATAKAMCTGSLNPAWVEWLMGYPLGWTVLKRLAIPSSRRSRKSSAEPS
jgi:hypothetical protein